MGACPLSVSSPELRLSAGEVPRRAAEVLTPDALGFIVRLEQGFGDRRRELLALRDDRRQELKAGALPRFLSETAQVRAGSWRIAPVPSDLRDRRVEITGPTDRKMVINALNSGARIFMADFEDANSPTWQNMVDGQANLMDATEGTIAYEGPDGRRYALGPDIATLVVRPRGWHLVEKHATLGGSPVSAALFDFGLFLFHNGRRLLEQGSGPYLYLPKLETHREARLWNDVFTYAEGDLDLPLGSIKATVLIETIGAAFEMDEILYELRDHAAGLNAGRWDYMFSVIKNLGHRPDFVLPDRNQVTMTAPFMRAYTELLVRTCHRRGAHAIGGMAAFIPSRRDPELNECALAKVREDKQREAGDGFDGTWVAHPDLVPTAMAEFDAVLGVRSNQLERTRAEVDVSADDLLAVAATEGTQTEDGLRNDVGVGLRYLASWLGGVGAAAIFNLMEDAATAEIARAQVWQWLRHGVRLDEGLLVEPGLVRRTIDEESSAIAAAGEVPRQLLAAAREVFEQVALAERLPEFLTLAAYDRLP